MFCFVKFTRKHRKHRGGSKKPKITEKFTKKTGFSLKKMAKRVQNPFFLNNIRLERIAFIICAFDLVVTTGSS
jgi:hypothetical protein